MKDLYPGMAATKWVTLMIKANALCPKDLHLLGITERMRRDIKSGRSTFSARREDLFAVGFFRNPTHTEMVNITDGFYRNQNNPPLPVEQCPELPDQSERVKNKINHEWGKFDARITKHNKVPWNFLPYSTLCHCEGEGGD